MDTVLTILVVSGVVVLLGVLISIYIMKKQEARAFQYATRTLRSISQQKSFVFCSVQGATTSVLSFIPRAITNPRFFTEHSSMADHCRHPYRCTNGPECSDDRGWTTPVYIC